MRAQMPDPLPRPTRTPIEDPPPEDVPPLDAPPEGDPFPEAPPLTLAQRPRRRLSVSA